MSNNNDKLQQQLHKVLDDLLALPENKYCADCAAKGPRWASATLGAFICIKCSGIHRSMGTHISFVRSVSLDKWTPEQVKVMETWGNAKVNELFEANLPENYPRPNENDSYSLEQFIRAKYDRKQWMKKDATREVQKEGHKKKNSSSSNPGTPKEQPKQPKPQVTNDLISLDTPETHDNSEFGAFQGVQPQTQIQSAPSGSSSSIENAFFGSFSTPNPSPQNPPTPTLTKSDSKPDLLNQGANKDSILSLYNQPLVPNQQTGSPLNSPTLSPASPSLNNPASPRQAPAPAFKPNYDINLAPVGQQGYRPPVAPVGYGGPAPGYGAPNPGFGGPAPGYGAPNPGYGGYQSGGFGGPMGGMGGNPGYGAPMGGNPGYVNPAFQGSPLMGGNPGYVNPAFQQNQNRANGGFTGF